MAELHDGRERFERHMEIQEALSQQVLSQEKRKLEAMTRFSDNEIRHAMRALAQRRLDACTEDDLEAEMARRGLDPRDTKHR